MAASSGGALAGYLYMKNRPVSTWEFADAVAPAIILGQVFGRFGNFMNGDAHGVPTTMPWGVEFPMTSIAGREFPGQATHPVMLYELFLNLAWFFILRRLRFTNHKPGFIFCLYFVLYSFGPRRGERFPRGQPVVRPRPRRLSRERAPHRRVRAVIVRWGMWEREG